MKNKITALMLVVLMILMQVPLSVFAAETTNTLTPDTLTNGAEDIKWYQDFTYSGSAYIDSVRITKGSLPDGVYLNSPSWTWFSISGTPTTMGTYSFTIEVKNENNEILTKDYTLTIERDFPLEIIPNYLNRAYEGSAYTESVYLTYQRKEKNKWKLDSVEGETLPDGLTIDEDTGDISWPSPQAGTYNLKITVTRKENTISKVLQLIVEPEGGCKHGNPTKTNGKAATCKENGTLDYWYCDDCGRYFLDAECKNETYRDLDKLYTTAFHSDKNDDGKCDTCEKTMPIFTKVTNEDEITSCGMYLVVSKIGEKYYTFKAPEENYMDNIEATEITQNSDGTFSYPESDTGVIILKTEFAAECGGLDAGLPRYNFATTINNIPYCLSSDDYSGSIQMYAYEESKYGYRIKLTDEEYAEMASVYAEYWGSGESGKGGESGILTAFEGTKDDTIKRFFSFRTKESYENTGIYTGYGDNYFYDALSSYPIELYKLTYSGNANGQNYTVADGQSLVTIGNEFTVVNSTESKECSTVGGISEAVKTSYIESVISGQTELTGDISVKTYADISVKSEESTTDEWDQTTITSLVYTITPKMEIKANDSEKTIVTNIADESFDGSGMTVSLCVGNMNPKQIIHHKADGTKEYFYYENSENLKPGQKTFSIDYGYEKGNFVTFTVDSFSDVEILAATVAEASITVGNAAVTAPVGGQTPSFTAVSSDPSKYSVEILRWIDVENNMDIELTDLSNVNSPYYDYKFKTGKQYEVVVRFTAVDDYTLSFDNNFTVNGEKTNWTGDGLKRTYTFTAKAPSTTTEVNENIFTVTGNYIDGCIVILALYREDSKGKSQFADCKTAVYDGEQIPFTVTATDYTSAKVMVWKTIENLEPVTEVEVVNIEKTVKK